LLEERITESWESNANVAAFGRGVFWWGLVRSSGRSFPKYLESLGASVTAVGLFGTAEDFFDAIYQYRVAGWRIIGAGVPFWFFCGGSRRLLIYLSSPTWPYLFLGLRLSWHGRPWVAVMFATLETRCRRNGAGWASRAIDAEENSDGDFAADRRSDDGGARLQRAFEPDLVTIALAAVASALLFSSDCNGGHDLVRMSGVVGLLSPTLKRLLASDIVIRMCAGMGIFLWFFT